MMPTPKRGPGRPKGSKTKNRTVAEEVSERLEIVPLPERRVLPEDPAELDAALAPHKMLVGPILTGISGTLEALGSTALTSREHSEGTFAFSCLAFQYGAQLDARLLVLAWMAGVSLPRISKWAKDRKTQGVQKLTAETLAKAAAQPEMQIQQAA